MSETLAVNSNISHYRIAKKIGAGGMGEVYLADDLHLRRKIALKVLPENIAQDKDRLRRFEQEAHSASALNHPNILTVHEFGAENGVHFLATEFVEGETLREKINGGELTVVEAIDIAEQTAFALSAAHSAGIVHRDLKPENIMIRLDGIVKILDFGLAKLTEKKEENPDAEAETRALVKTNPGVVMGTVSYMSPEQARGKNTDARTDIWSLGVVLYEMITRHLPFAGETVNDAIAKGMYAEAIAEYQEAIRLRGSGDLIFIGATDLEAVLGAAYAKSGERAKAEEILQKLKDKSRNEIAPRSLAILYAALGMRDEAFAQLEKAYTEHSSNLPFIAVEPIYDNLRDDPRFQDLLRRMGLPQ